MRTVLATIAALTIAVSPMFALPAAAQTAAPAGASSCSGCHDAKVANAPPPLKGRPSAEIVTAMQEFRSGKREATVMGRIAKGFSDEETQAIATWLSQR